VAVVALAAVLVLGALTLAGGPADGPSPCTDVPRPSVDPGSAPLDRLELWLSAPNGTRLATVEARLAASPDARRIGLRETDHLDDGEGMLFVHGSDSTWTYRTDGVAFPLDIVFAGSQGEIRTIHHAAVTEGDEGYAGRAQYILQVPRGYTNRTGVAVGDCLAVPPGLRNAA
jgi:hypothetical protein